MKVSFVNLGCKVNFAEMAQIEEQFLEMGHEVVEYGSDCDAIFINTCSVTKKADADSRKMIRRSISRHPEAFVGVMGCFAQLEAGLIAEIEGVDAIFGTNEKFHIQEFIQNFERRDQPLIFVDDMNHIEFQAACSEEDESHTRVIFKIQDGCDYFCSYCTVPYARGRSRSLPIEDIAPKLFELKASGYNEIVLTGINIGEYKSSDGARFVDVVRLIDKLDLDIRVRISSIEPNLLTDEIIDLVARSKIFCPHFHIPLQSGSDKILKLMGRRYGTEDFRNTILKIIDKIPDACLGIDVISGFPGESEEDFRDTYYLLEKLPISYLHVFSYSERDRTRAVNFPGKVKSSDITKRTFELRNLSYTKKQQFYDNQIGKIVSIIPETYVEADGHWKGWSQNYVRTHFPGTKNLTKDPINVKLVENRADFVIGIAENR